MTCTGIDFGPNPHEWERDFLLCKQRCRRCKNVLTDMEMALLTYNGTLDEYYGGCPGTDEDPRWPRERWMTDAEYARHCDRMNERLATNGSVVDACPYARGSSLTS